MKFEEPESINNMPLTQVWDLKDKRSRNIGALGLISRGVIDIIFSKVMKATQAKQAWDIL